jgi:hypothetical protein
MRVLRERILLYLELFFNQKKRSARVNLRNRWMKRQCVGRTDGRTAWAQASRVRPRPPVPFHVPADSASGGVSVNVLPAREEQARRGRSFSLENGIFFKSLGLSTT